MGKPVNKTLRIAAMSAGEEIGHVSGPIVTFRGNGAPLHTLLVNIEPVQSGTGDPSPDNVRPISGWSAVNVWRTGKNLFNPQSTSTAWVDWQGNITTVSSAKTVKILARAGDTFTLSNANASSGTNSLLIAFFDETDTIISSRHIATTGEKFVTATAPAGTDYMIAGYYRWSESAEQQLELSFTATSYEPYSGNQYTIQLGQTFYGGTLDVTNGVLTVDRAMVDLGTLEWIYQENLSRFYTTGIRDTSAKPASLAAVNAICSAYALSASGNNGTFLIGTDGTLYIWDSSYVDATSFKNGVTGQQFVFELATPITIPLTPQEISTLQGQNNVWADSGDVDVEYIATGGQGGKLALLLRNRKELLIALRKGLSPAEAGLLGSIPSFGGSLSPGVIRPGLNTQEEEEDEKDDA